MGDKSTIIKKLRDMPSSNTSVHFEEGGKNSTLD
jgi:hypothetical protein